MGDDLGVFSFSLERCHNFKIHDTYVNKNIFKITTLAFHLMMNVIILLAAHCVNH